MTGESRSFLDDGSPFAEGIGNTSLAVFLLAIWIPVRGFETIFPALGEWPVNSVAILLLGAVGVVAAARWQVKQPVVVLAGVLLPIWLVTSTWLLHGDPAFRRSMNIIALLVGAAAIATGRIHLRSLIRGLTVGLVLALVVSAARAVTRDERLSGLLGDPNQAGFIAVTMGLIAMQGARRTPDKAFLLIVTGASVMLTVSRTSMFAMLVGVLWAVVGYRLPRWLAAGFLIVAVPLYTALVNLVNTQSWFVEREGSDALRVRLAAAERAAVADAGWTGQGLGTTVVDLGDVTLFFHNSYRAMYQEGGLIALGLLVILLAGLFVMGGRLPPQRRCSWAEAAIIAAAICSFNIGFSITHPVFAVAVGCLIAFNTAARDGIDWERQPVHLPKGVQTPVIESVQRLG